MTFRLIPYRMETPSRKNKINATLLFTLLGLIGTIATLFRNSNLYTGQQLVDKTLVLRSKPEHIQRHKVPDYFKFKDQHYPCTFIISDGAYTLVMKYQQIQNLIKEINEGDNIEVNIKLSDENAVYDASKQVEIIGLKYNTIQLISPEEVKKENQKAPFITYGLFPSIFFIGLCGLFYKKIFPGND